jgi:hypothetical protein
MGGERIEAEVLKVYRDAGKERDEGGILVGERVRERSGKAGHKRNARKDEKQKEEGN